MTLASLALRGFLPAIAVALVGTPIARRVALRVEALDRPANHKAHVSPTPYFGGLSILAAFLAGAAGLGLWNRVPAFVIGAVILTLVGVVDDLANLLWWPRIAAQLLAAGLVVGGGLHPAITGIGALDIAIAMLWIVGITNAFNLLDNMNGLSAGTAGVAGIAFFAIAWQGGQPLTAGLCAVLVGAVIGFLPFNFPRAKIFMGDAGSTLLGFCLAVLGLRIARPLGGVALAVPVSVLALAVIDTCVVVFDRVRSGHRITWGGKDHLSHRVAGYGFTHLATVWILFGATSSLGLVAVLATRGSLPMYAPLAALGVAAAAGLNLLRVPVSRPAPSERPSVATARPTRVVDLRVFERNGAAAVSNGNGVAANGKAPAKPAHAFTVDLEEWFHGIELPEDQWPEESRIAVGMERLMPLLERHEVKATFFVLGAVAARHPNLVAELARSGHEIACHGYLHRFVYEQSPREFMDDVRRAKDAIAEASGVVPSGFRAPYFSVRHDSMWALDVLAGEGFAYDASIFPVRNDRYGIPDAPTTPHDVETQMGTLREVPMTPLRVLGANMPFSGGAYLRILPWWAQSLMWRRATASGQPAIAYIHPWELDPEHPRLDVRRRVAATHYARLRVTEPRLDRLMATYRFGRLDEVMGIKPPRQVRAARPARRGPAVVDLRHASLASSPAIPAVDLGGHAHR